MKVLGQTVEISGLNELSDEELARNAAGGSHPCFEAIVYRYGSRLFQFLRTRIPSIQDAEDLTQDTFVKAYQNIQRFDDQRKFSTWLYTIASRLAIDFYRTHGRKESQINRFESEKDMDFPDETITHNPQEQLLVNEDSENLWNAARTLKPEQYEALWLRYAEELSVQEIAEVMKKNKVSVRVMLHRARSKLSAVLLQKYELKDDDLNEENEHVLFST